MVTLALNGGWRQHQSDKGSGVFNSGFRIDPFPSSSDN
jgi:hypothetical protein